MKKIIIIGLIFALLIVGCTSSYKDCTNDCKWDIYCDLTMMDLIEGTADCGNMTEEEVDRKCFEHCSGAS